MKKYIITLTLLLLTCFLSQAQELASGSYDGFGRIIYDNGQEYIGELKNGDPHGYGKTLYSSGHIYVGEYNNGTKHGYGVFMWKNGNNFYGKFKNGKEDGYAVKTEKRSPSIGGVRFLINEWEDGELKKSSVKELDDQSGCLIGKCDHNSKTGIYSYGNQIGVGNINQAVVFTKSSFQRKIYIGEFNDQGKLQKGLIVSSLSYSNGGDLEFINIKNGTWNSYYANSNKKIYVRTWIDDKMIEEVPIDDVNTKISAPPSLMVDNIEFNDFNSNKLLEANEQATISFNIKNIGKGSAYGISIQIDDKNNIKGLSYDRNKQINILKPQSVNSITIPITASMSLETGQVSFNIKISEGNGFDADPIDLSIETQSFIPPDLEIVDYVFSSDAGVMRKGETVNLQFVIQNIGQGMAEDIKIRISIPDKVYPFDEQYYSINRLISGEKKLFDFSFAANKRFSSDTLSITAKLSEKYDKYAKDKIMSVKMEQDISNAIELTIESTANQNTVDIKPFSLNSHVDEDIPVNSKVNNRYALVIGNEDYTSSQRTLSSEQNVDYAINDATIFKKYCLNTLGVKEDNMHFLLNATAGQMSQEIDLISKILSKLGDEAELIVYYAGHGFPDELTKTPYLIPVDVSATNLSSAIKLSDIYTKLSSTGASKVTVFLDACFTGGGRDLGLISSRGVKVKPREGSLRGNLVVFSASSGDQSSLPYHDEGHGMFTYHLLKKLQETKGDVSMGELSNYLDANVSLQSLKENKKEQDPKVSTSQKVNNEWRNWKF